MSCLDRGTLRIKKEAGLQGDLMSCYGSLLVLLISSCILHLVQRKKARFSLRGLNVSEVVGPACCPKEQPLSKAAPVALFPALT